MSGSFLLHETSNRLEFDQLYFQVSSLDPHPNFSPIQFGPFKVITGKLFVENVPEIFERDKPKNIHAVVSLINHDGKAVPGQRITLVPTLYYENGSIVENQSILEVISCQMIEGTKHSEIIFRINELSSKHDDKRFVVCISPYNGFAPMISEFTEVKTNPILVVSKINPQNQQQPSSPTNTTTTSQTETTSSSSDDARTSILPVETENIQNIGGKRSFSHSSTHSSPQEEQPNTRRRFDSNYYQMCLQDVESLLI